MTITIPSGRTIALAAKDGGGFQSEGLVVPPAGSFTPMVAEDFSSQTAGQTNADWARASYSSVVAKSGSLSTRLLTDPGQPPSVCGGSTYFGNRRTLPAIVPAGKTVWQRFFFYLPPAFSMGYLYDSGDSSEASTCGGAPIDGGAANLKWMVFAPNASTARTYFQPFIAKRQALQNSNPGARVISEAGATSSTNPTAAALPRGQWFSMELALKVSKSGDGYIRGWVDGQMVHEVVGINTISGSDTGIDEWGIGDYWNGLPWTDGAAGRDTFYIDEIIVASDADGYGAPTAVDPEGNTYIGPTTLVGDLA